MLEFPERGDLEKSFLDGLRAQYAEQGFTVIVEPPAEQVPGFLGSYRPDAIARKPGENVAIEVLRRSGPAGQRPLQEIRRLFQGHPEWRLVVANMGSAPQNLPSIPKATAAAIGSSLVEVKNLIAHGQRRAAFVMAWALLEATAYRLEEGRGGPRQLGSIVQGLAMLGHVNPETERRMLALIDLRNRIVHGDLEADPTIQDVELLLSVIPQTLEADAA